MGWIANVLPHTTITSAWGNLVRSQLVQRFTSFSDRDAQTNAVRQSGMLAYTESERMYSFVDNDNNTWRSFPQVQAGVTLVTFIDPGGFGGIVEATITFPRAFIGANPTALLGAYFTGSAIPFVQSVTTTGMVLRIQPNQASGFQLYVSWIAVVPT